MKCRPESTTKAPNELKCRLCRAGLLPTYTRKRKQMFAKMRLFVSFLAEICHSRALYRNIHISTNIHHFSSGKIAMNRNRRLYTTKCLAVSRKQKYSCSLLWNIDMCACSMKWKLTTGKDVVMNSRSRIRLLVLRLKLTSPRCAAMKLDTSRLRLELCRNLFSQELSTTGINSKKVWSTPVS